MNTDDVEKAVVEDRLITVENRLVEKGCRTRRQRLSLEVVSAETRHDDVRYAHASAPKHLEDSDAVEAWEAHVGNDQVQSRLLGKLEPLVTGRGDNHVVPGKAQN